MNPLILIFVFLLVFVKGKSSAPPNSFSSAGFLSGEDTITVNNVSLGGSNPVGTVSNNNGTVTIKATITKEKAKTISAQIITELANFFTSEQNIINIILQCKNDADYALVSSAFGEHGQGFISQALDDSILAVGKRNLTAWIIGVVEDGYHLRQLHARFPTVF